ncbi:MAG: LysR family transcriptional regulator, partial [Spongiibacteraceae bacterium]
MSIKHINRLTLRQIEVFLAVCQHQSYSKAAEQLSLTQPAVSAQIRNLEEVVSQPLFDYLGKKLFLTPAGKVMARSARDLQQRLANLEIELTELHGRLEGTLNIAIESAAEQFMPAHIEYFQQQHDQVDIVLSVANHQQLLNRLSDNLDDLVIMTQVPEGPAFHYQPFAEHRLLAVAAPNHPLSKESDISAVSFCKQRLVLREAGSGTRRIFADYCRQQSCVVGSTGEMGSNQAIKHSLASGRSCAVLPEAVVADFLQRGLL